MKVKLIGFFSSVVWMAPILGAFRWANWLDSRSVFSLAIVLLLLSVSEEAWRQLWKKQKQKYGLHEEPQRSYYSSFEFSGYLTIDVFCWLKKKAKTPFGNRNKKENR